MELFSACIPYPIVLVRAIDLLRADVKEKNKTRFDRMKKKEELSRYEMSKFMREMVLGGKSSEI